MTTSAHSISFLCWAWAFIAGFAFYRFRETVGNPLWPILIGATLICYYQSGSQEQYAPITFACSLAIVYYAPLIRLTERTRRLCLWLGNISLCLYLTHVPVLDMAVGFGYKNGYVIAICCLLFAIMTYYCIDLPVQTYRRVSVRRRAALAA